MTVNILFVGDIIGKPGMDITATWLPGLKNKYRADFVIANGENSADGKGCTEKEASQLFELGVNCITGGNHTWDRRQSQELIKTEKRVLRPHNYPRGTYGSGLFVADTPKGKIAVINLQGRAFMSPIECPFRTADYLLKQLSNDVKMIFIDFHAEATAEKMALAHYLDGKISVLVGTHTHIQTADERIFPNGTAFITDVGMTGPYDSVIGMKKDAAINRFLYQTPQKYQTAVEQNHLSAIIAKVDSVSGKATTIERIVIPEFENKIEQ